MKKITWTQFMTFRTAAYEDIKNNLAREYGDMYKHLETSDCEALVKMAISEFIEMLSLHNYIEIDHSK